MLAGYTTIVVITLRGVLCFKDTRSVCIYTGVRDVCVSVYTELCVPVCVLF